MQIKRSDIMITSKKLAYIEILTRDLCLTRHQRNRWISIELKREIKFLDEITKFEANHVIGRMKEMKENNRRLYL